MKLYDRVYLNKDIDYVFCFLKETIIKEEECDYYEHNLECDHNHDVFNRTHSKGSMAGYYYAYKAGNVLNSCEYCLKKDKARMYLLPEKAIPLFNKKKEKDSLIYRIRSKIR